MSKEVFYRQCHLKRKTKNSTWETTSYIPEPFCQVGKVLKLRDEDGKWEDGWVVESAGQRTAEGTVDSINQMWKRMAKQIK